MNTIRQNPVVAGILEAVRLFFKLIGWLLIALVVAYFTAGLIMTLMDAL
jgi:hypothetical protein